jgi:hypothetical protein
MEAHAVDARMPAVAAGLSVRGTHDPRRQAREQAFARALGRRAGNGNPRAAAPPPVAHAGATGTPSANEPAATPAHAGDGDVHVDVVV